MQHARHRGALVRPCLDRDRDPHSGRNRRVRSRVACPRDHVRTDVRHHVCLLFRVLPYRVLPYRVRAHDGRRSPSGRDRRPARPTSETARRAGACGRVDCLRTVLCGALACVRIRVRILRMRSSLLSPLYRLTRRRYIGDTLLTRCRGNLFVFAPRNASPVAFARWNYPGRYEVSSSTPNPDGRRRCCVLAVVQQSSRPPEQRDQRSRPSTRRPPSIVDSRGTRCRATPIRRAWGPVRKWLQANRIRLD